MLLTVTSGHIQRNIAAAARTSLLHCSASVRSNSKLAFGPVALPRDAMAESTADSPIASHLYSDGPSVHHQSPLSCSSADSHRLSSRARQPESALVCSLVASQSLQSAGPSAVAVDPARLLLPSQFQIAASLSKARLTGLVVCSAVAGALLAGSTSMASQVFLLHPMRTLACLAVGTGLTSAAANTVNQIMEIPHDSQMMRTQNRPLVRGLTSPGRAGIFALGCMSTGMSVLCLGTNSLVASLALANLLLYTAVYTPLKQVDQANTWIGSLVGAVPPLMGWAAATGQLQSGSLFLACLLYVWQFPHFMALSWNLRSQYSRAGYAMTCILEPAMCRRVALKYAVASGLVCLAGAGCSALSLGPWAGCALGLSCLPPNVGLVYYAWQFARSGRTGPDSASLAARRLFRASLLHLPVVMVVALIGTYFCTASA